MEIIMALTPLTERQKTLIVNNVVVACSDITKLNKTGYNFMYLACGFIAHYNVYGFIGHYERYSLKDNILRNERANMWYNFTPLDKDYEYYASKADVYLRIIEALRK
jgi:hypothetical protein